MEARASVRTPSYAPEKTGYYMVSGYLEVSGLPFGCQWFRIVYHATRQADVFLYFKFTIYIYLKCLCNNFMASPLLLWSSVLMRIIYKFF